MRKLYTIPNSESCKQIKDWIKEQSDPVEVQIIELVGLENEWHEKTENGYIKFDKSVSSFPALFIGKQNDNNIYVMGEDGIKSILSKGYIYDSKFCPYIKGSCMEKECAKFVLLTKGPLLEGNCSDYWAPVLLTELLVRGN